MASLVPDEVNGEGFSSITVQKLLGVSGRSQAKLPWKSAVARGNVMSTVQ